MTRQERLKYCQVCSNRRFEPRQGLVCNLTGEWASFNKDCDFFAADELAIRNQHIFEKNIANSTINEDPTFGLNKIGIKNGFVAGIILIIIGLGWLIAGLYYDVLFYYPIIFIFFGVLAVIISSVNRLKKAKVSHKMRQLEELVDN